MKTKDMKHRRGSIDGSEYWERMIWQGVAGQLLVLIGWIWAFVLPLLGALLGGPGSFRLMLPTFIGASVFAIAAICCFAAAGINSIRLARVRCYRDEYAPKSSILGYWLVNFLILFPTLYVVFRAFSPS